MQVLFITLFAMLIASPLHTQYLFRSSVQWESEQISLDNIAIELGQSERDLLNEFEAGAQKLTASDRGHHPVHACAKIPSPEAVSCSTADRLLEMKLNVQKEVVVALAQQKWQRARAKLYGQLYKKKLIPTVVLRTDVLPIQKDLCMICGLPMRLRIASSTGPLKTYVRIAGSPGLPREILLQSVQKFGTKWNYRLRPGEAGE